MCEDLNLDYMRSHRTVTRAHKHPYTNMTLSSACARPMTVSWVGKTSEGVKYPYSAGYRG